MNLRLRNTWKYKGEDHWEWIVFLEDDGSGALDEINFVEYVLHPTFPNPRSIRNNRATNFALAAKGWGSFNIKAFAHNKSGEKIKLEHFLHLEYEPETGVTD